MEIKQQKEGDVVLLGLEGRLDTLSSRTLDTHLKELIEGNTHQILIDFSQLEFISSSGLRVLLSLGKQINRLKGSLALCTLQDRVMDVFDMAGFSTLFEIFPSKEEALKHFEN